MEWSRINSRFFVHIVYILLSRNDPSKYYIGITENFADRLKDNNQSRSGYVNMKRTIFIFFFVGICVTTLFTAAFAKLPNYTPKFIMSTSQSVSSGDQASEELQAAVGLQAVLSSTDFSSWASTWGIESYSI